MPEHTAVIFDQRTCCSILSCILLAGTEVVGKKHLWYMAEELHNG